MLLAFVDQPQRHKRLTVFPVVAADEPQLSYLLMGEAIQTGLLTIMATGSGRPSYLIAENRSTEPVLILDCEAVSGTDVVHSSSQSVLLAPSSVTRIPVSCTAMGKWGCEKVAARYSRAFSRFPLLPRQVGVLVFLGRHLLGLDVLGCPRLYSPLHRRLLVGYMFADREAGTDEALDVSAAVCEIQALAQALERANREAAPCPGYGEYSTLHGEVTGGELRHNGHLVHLSVFPAGVQA